MNDYERNADVSKTLTEQWKQGELSSGWYYVRLIRGEYRIDLYISDKNEWIDCPDNIIDTIVCEVPSYEELQNQVFILKSRESEIVKLKGLLKECRYIMGIEKDFASCHFEKDKLGKLCEQITEVLGEE